MQKIMFDEHYGLETAVLERLKTKTRRIIKVPDTWHGIQVCGFGRDIDGQSLLLYDADGYLIEDPKTHLCGQIMPKYKVGEIVAVAQKYKDLRWPTPQRSDFQEILHSAGWNNKMYVRADLMPHEIQINGCHVERLQDISDEDCLKEGIIEYAPCCECGSELYAFDGADDFWYTPREAFAALINKTSGKHTWEDNPYTFVYGFELVR